MKRKSGENRISYQFLCDSFGKPEIEKPSIVVNLIGDFPEEGNTDALKKELIDLLNTLNRVHGWLFVSGKKTIEMVEKLLQNECSNVVDRLDHLLVCIAVRPIMNCSSEHNSKVNFRNLLLQLFEFPN